LSAAFLSMFSLGMTPPWQDSSRNQHCAVAALKPAFVDTGRA